MGQADDYRKRADVLARALKKRAAHEREPMQKKQKALLDMADNEDWLDGKATATHCEPVPRKQRTGWFSTAIKIGAE